MDGMQFEDLHIFSINQIKTKCRCIDEWCVGIRQHQQVQKCKFIVCVHFIEKNVCWSLDGHVQVGQSEKDERFR